MHIMVSLERRIFLVGVFKCFAKRFFVSRDVNPARESKHFWFKGGWLCIFALIFLSLNHIDLRDAKIVAASVFEPTKRRVDEGSTSPSWNA